MSNRRILDYLAAADLARTQIERERQRGANETARVKQIAGLATTVPGLIGSVVGAYGQSVDADAATAAQDLVARHKGDLGQRAEGPSDASGTIPYASTAGEEAARIVGADKALSPEKPKGIAGFLADPLGWKESAAKRARAQATSQLAGNIEQGRAAAQGSERERNQDAFTRSRLEAQDKTQAEDRDEKRLDALVKTSVAAGLARGFDDADILEQAFALADSQGFPVNETRIYAELDAQKRARGGAEVEEQLKRSQIERNAAQAKKTARTPPRSAGGNASGDFFGIDKVDARKLRQMRFDLSDVKTQGNALRALAQKYHVEDYVGPLDKIAEAIKQRTGLQDSEAAEVQSTIRQYFNNYRRVITGAAAAHAELKDLEATAPNVGDTFNVILGKLDATDNLISPRMQQIDVVLTTGDIRGARPAPSANSEDVVIVTDGRETLQIPRSDLADAMRDGFREVQQ